MNMAQMADNPNIKVFWPGPVPDGKQSTFALPYYVGLVKGAPDAPTTARSSSTSC
ncbi:MAG: hypothetical protein WDM84_03130 [Bauldia sp.]